jgi:hypothetical protein
MVSEAQYKHIWLVKYSIEVPPETNLEFLDVVNPFASCKMEVIDREIRNCMAQIRVVVSGTKELELFGACHSVIFCFGSFTICGKLRWELVGYK